MSAPMPRRSPRCSARISSKIKLSTDHLEQGRAKKVYEKYGIDVSSQAERVKHCMQAAFGGRRIVVFLGGAAKGGTRSMTIAPSATVAATVDHRAQHLPALAREDALQMLDRLVGSQGAP